MQAGGPDNPYQEANRSTDNYFIRVGTGPYTFPVAVEIL